MWIQSNHDPHAGGAFRDERVSELNDGEPVEFNENGKAQVSSDVGDYLTSEYDEFSTTDASEAPDEDEADADEEPDDTTDDAESEGDN